MLLGSVSVRTFRWKDLRMSRQLRTVGLAQLWRVSAFSILIQYDNNRTLVFPPPQTANIFMRPQAENLRQQRLRFRRAAAAVLAANAAALTIAGDSHPALSFWLCFCLASFLTTLAFSTRIPCELCLQSGGQLTSVSDSFPLETESASRSMTCTVSADTVAVLS